MSTLWQILLPAAGTNLLPSPTIETDAGIGFGYAATGTATLARDRTTAKFGGSCMSIVSGGAGASEGAITGYIDVTPSNPYVCSVYMRGSAGGELVTLALRESTAALATVGDAVSSIITLTTTWTRYEISRTFGATGAKARVIIRTAGTHVYTWYTDAWQLEAGTVATTYIDGNQAGCSWTGAQYNSTSVRDAQTRSGGVITNFDSLGTGITDNGSGSGSGMPPHDHISTSYGLLDGSLFQRTGIKSRTFIVPVWVNGTTLADYHAQRKALINAVKRDLVTPMQPCRIRYTGGSEPVEIDAHYDGGLEGAGRANFTETIPLRFIADDPYWRSPGNAAVGLVYKADLSNAAYVVERMATGAWHVPGRGVQVGGVLVAGYGPDGLLYVGGNFGLAIDSAGATVAGTAYIARYNHLAATPTWEALNGGLNGAVYALAWDAAGTLYAGGLFTTANGATATSTNYIAKWNGSVWSAVGGNVGTGGVLALAYGANGNLYLAGTFANWPNAELAADGDMIVYWDGSAYHRMGGGVAGNVSDLAVAANGDVYVAGYFANAKLAGGAAVANTAYLARWAASAATPAWAAVGSTVLNNYVGGVCFDTAGNLYIGGAFTNAGFPYIARFTGAAWVPLGSGINDYVSFMARDLDGSIVVSGNFTMAGGLSFNDKVARWTGSAWVPLDIDLPGGPIAYRVAIHPDGRLALPFTTSGTATASSTTTPVINRGTGSSSPVFRILGPGLLESIANWTTHQGIFLNYQLQAGEYLTIDCRPGRVSCVSTLRGDVMGTAILPASVLAGFQLLSGLNTLVTKMPSGTTAATEVSCIFRENYLSNDV
jgi:hypothetical protein